MSEKLQKSLARAGLGSRREIESWIAEGRLSVNGETATIGARVTIADDIRLDGRKLRLLPEQLINRKVLMVHKPEGQITTRKDPEGRDTVFENLPTLRGSRWVSIGRLDLNTSGLLLFTNDGELANRLMHPKYGIQREYAVRIMGELTPSIRRRLQDGVLLDDGMAKFNSIESKGGTGANRWYHVTLSEGRTREVRRMFESVNLMVSRLIRVKYGPVELDPMLKQGMYRELSKTEMDDLCAVVHLDPQASRSERRHEVSQEKGRLHSEEKQVTKQRYADEYEATAVLKKPRLSKRVQAVKAYEETKGLASEKAPRSNRAAPVLRESERKKIAIEKKKALAEREETTGRFGKAKTRTGTRVGAKAESGSAPAKARRVTRTVEREDELSERPRRTARTATRSSEEAPRSRRKSVSAESAERGGVAERPRRSTRSAAHSPEEAPRARRKSGFAGSVESSERGGAAERPRRSTRSVERSGEDAPRARSRSKAAEPREAGSRSSRTSAARSPAARAPRSDARSSGSRSGGTSAGGTRTDGTGSGRSGPRGTSSRSTPKPRR